ncbi:hypothetical protein E4U43_008438 [Claviceps pusilla]|uniref:LYC1 C-terminal domain-containing protein n=1 Tax=Claviceps pusilla TaxID=123648 RepID=A0A9P7NGH1_9HYPO|nr:hypothetical protein E4U43_008438 [Claviceps pusilla]
MTLPTGPLILAKATPDERTSTWVRHQPHWGSSFTPQAYVSREERLLSLGLTRDGGLTIWALTQDTNNSIDTDSTNDVNNAKNAKNASGRPILSSLEVYRKRAIVRGTNGIVRDVTAHGVATVFTPPKNRRKGYGSKMLSLLGDELAQQQSQEPGSAEFSILFSDVGKTFYAQQQWMPFPSTHLSFSVTPFTTTNNATEDDCLTLITNENLPMIAELDEQTVREKLARPPLRPNTVRVAILPDLATYEWYLTRAGILTTHLLGKAPTVHGAMYNPPGRPHSRVWMLWSPAVSGGSHSPDKNVMNILHYALEDPAIPDDVLSRALNTIMCVAQTQAKEWLCSRIDMWNPEDRIRVLLQQSVSLPSELVDRETSCIASLRWFGEGSVSDVEWVDNQKFEWC